MPVNAEQIARMEQELAEAKRQLLEEDGRRYQILRREIAEEEWERILNNLTERDERVLFGLEAPEEPRRRGTQRPAKSGGDLACPICGKAGLTRRGLSLHMARLHKGERAGEAEAAA